MGLQSSLREAQARGIEAEPPAKRDSATRVMERIARRERAKLAKRLAQLKIKNFILIGEHLPECCAS
jgi:hypothetical protein